MWPFNRQSRSVFDASGRIATLTAENTRLFTELSIVRIAMNGKDDEIDELEKTAALRLDKIRALDNLVLAKDAENARLRQLAELATPRDLSGRFTKRAS
jgi:hypothetical protein